MQYKTITLQLLQDRPEFLELLRSQRMLLSTLELLASQLKTRHETWKGILSQAKPDTDPAQIASAALEMALQEMEDRLPSGSPPDDHQPISLDAAMAYIRRHTPPA